jgi:hypothetical protein
MKGRGTWPVWALAACAQAASLAHAAEPAPQDFAYGYPIVASPEASAYRITLPLAIYRGTVRDDLGDLAVFNARGEVVPFFIREIPSETPSAHPPELLPLFPLLVAPSRADPCWASETVTARPDPRRDYVFDLGGHVPVQRVDLRLAEANSVVVADLYSRKDLHGAWNFVTRARFFRIHTPSGDRENEPVDVPLNRDRYWLARTTNPASAGELSLIAAWHPSELVFLAQGNPPFLLAYGSNSSTGIRTDLTPFVSSIAVLPATLAKAERLGGAVRLVAARPPFAWRRWILWLVLFGAVAALGYMAARLLEETAGPEPPAD